VEAGVGPDDLLELVRRAREALRIPVIASLNGTSPGGWVEHARLLEQAGADALELNLYQVAADPAHDAATLEAREVELVETVRAGIEIPLAVKLSPFYTAFAHFARRIALAGAQGLVLFNRFYQPDLDLETLDVRPHLVLSRPEESRLALRWIAILRRRLSASLAASSGVHGAEEVLKLLLAGADVTMMASALLQRGVAIVPEIEAALARWLDEREYESVEQMQGSVSQAAVRDPDAFERAQYRSTLLSWR
jgi:dihydroorotate dehydrogenase (fumarate)